jgi:epoxyqueuosine reductase QueG
MEKLTRRVLQLARCYGAGAMGIVSTEMLAEGPPSTDLTYVLPDAKSAVSFALPLDQGLIEPLVQQTGSRCSFSKQHPHECHGQRNINGNRQLSET